MSAYILHLETSTKICSVAISQNGVLLAYQDQTGEAYIHGEELTLMIQAILRQTNLNLQNISAISYSSGPGSYTGLRIGLSTAKGLCFALSIPLIALPTHQILLELALANDFKNAKKVIALLDARRTEVYMQVFDCQGGSENELRSSLATPMRKQKLFGQTHPFNGLTNLFAQNIKLLEPSRLLKKKLLKTSPTVAPFI